jgi:hypothetical protein
MNPWKFQVGTAKHSEKRARLSKKDVPKAKDKQAMVNEL